MKKELVENALRILKSTEAFVLEQAPDVVRELYQWKLIEAGFGMFIGIILIIASIVCFKLTRKSEEGSFGAFILIVVTPLALVSGVITTSTFLMNALHIIIAPKLFLIKELSRLL